MFPLLLLLLLAAAGTEQILPSDREQLGLLSSAGVGTDYIYLTIQSSKGVKSWYGALMVSIGPSYNQSNDRNVCQRYKGIDYSLSAATAETICKLNNFNKLDSVRPMDYWVTWWATDIDPGVRNLSCTGATCSYTNGDECDSYSYYTTLSCSCTAGYYKTTSGCKTCPTGAACSGNSTSWTCRAGYEPHGNDCDLCWGYNEFTDGKKYKYCTECPYDTNSKRDGCICDPYTNEIGDRAWDYDTNTCIQCPEDTFRNETTNRCTACPSGGHTYGTGKVDVGDCLFCIPSEVHLFGKCVERAAFYLSLSLSLGVIVFFSCCCCYCCCCRKRKPPPPPITIRHNAAVEAEEGPQIETNHTTSSTPRDPHLQSAPQPAGPIRIEAGAPTDPSAPPPSLFHTPAYNPGFQAQAPPWQPPQYNAQYISGPPNQQGAPAPNCAPPQYSTQYVPGPTSQQGVHAPNCAPPSYNEIMAQAEYS